MDFFNDLRTDEWYNKYRKWRRLRYEIHNKAEAKSSKARNPTARIQWPEKSNDNIISLDLKFLE